LRIADCGLSEPTRPALKIFQKLIERHSRLLENMSECTALDRAMSGYGDLDRLVRQMLLKSDVAALLPNHNKSTSLEGPHNAVVVF